MPNSPLQVLAIGAASIVAKVTRDRLMREYDRKWPAYGFAQHKGYPTAQHMAAIRQHGPCVIHRRTFAPLKTMNLPPLPGDAVAVAPKGEKATSKGGQERREATRKGATGKKSAAGASKTSKGTAGKKAPPTKAKKGRAGSTAMAGAISKAHPKPALPSHPVRIQTSVRRSVRLNK